MDINKSTGACNAAFSLPEAVVTPGATPPVQTIVTTSFISWTGAPAPIATIEVSSGNKRLQSGSVAGIVTVIFVYMILQI